MNELKIVPSYEIRIKVHEEARNELRNNINNLMDTYQKYRGLYPGYFRSVLIHTDHLDGICRDIDLDIKALWEEYDQAKRGIVPESTGMSLSNRLKPLKALLACLLTLGWSRYNWKFNMKGQPSH